EVLSSRISGSRNQKIWSPKSKPTPTIPQDISEPLTTVTPMLGNPSMPCTWSTPLTGSGVCSGKPLRKRYVFNRSVSLYQAQKAARPDITTTENAVTTDEMASTSVQMVSLIALHAIFKTG